jgi:hypothetical protein
MLLIMRHALSSEAIRTLPQGDQALIRILGIPIPPQHHAKHCKVDANLLFCIVYLSYVLQLYMQVYFSRIL